jgi:hypothetical protein
MAGWVYESGNLDQPAIFLLGWDDWAPYPVDPKVAATTIRHGKFDYVTNSVKWDPSITTQALPNSLYLSGKPAFFGAGRGYTWPWFDPTGATKRCRPSTCSRRWWGRLPSTKPACIQALAQIRTGGDTSRSRPCGLGGARRAWKWALDRTNL